MKIGPFQFRDVHKDDKDADPFELVGQMFRQLRDIVDQINKAPFVSDNVLRRVVAVPTQAAADERPVFVSPGLVQRNVLEDASIIFRANVAAGTVFTLKRYTATTNFPVGAWDTTTNGAIAQFNRKSMVLQGQEKLILAPQEILNLSITGNVPVEGLIVLTLNEVFP